MARMLSQRCPKVPFQKLVLSIRKEYDLDDSSSQVEAGEVRAGQVALEDAPVIEDTLLSDVEPYWTPGAEPPTPIDTSGLEPLEIQEVVATLPTVAEEEAQAGEDLVDPEETSLFGNLRSVAETNDWAGNATGDAGFAPIGPPSGFITPPGFSPTRRGGDSMFRGFGLALNASGTYDSNITQADGSAGKDATDDFITSFGATLSYMAENSYWTFGGNYSGAYNFYLNNSDFSGYTQRGRLLANYDGAKLVASLTTGISTGRGGNRFLGTGNFVEQTQFDLGLSVGYALSEKTILTADAGTGYIATSGGDFSNTNSGFLGFGALWKYSPADCVWSGHSIYPR